MTATSAPSPTGSLRRGEETQEVGEGGASGGDGGKMIKSEVLLFTLYVDKYL